MAFDFVGEVSVAYFKRKDKQDLSTSLNFILAAKESFSAEFNALINMFFFF